MRLEDDFEEVLREGSIRESVDADDILRDLDESLDMIGHVLDDFEVLSYL